MSPLALCKPWWWCLYKVLLLGCRNGTTFEWWSYFSARLVEETRRWRCRSAASLRILIAAVQGDVLSHTNPSLSCTSRTICALPIYTIKMKTKWKKMSLAVLGSKRLEEFMMMMLAWTRQDKTMAATAAFCAASPFSWRRSVHKIVISIIINAYMAPNSRDLAPTFRISSRSSIALLKKIKRGLCEILVTVQLLLLQLLSLFSVAAFRLLAKSISQ